MDFQQIRDFVNPAVAQATGMQEVENLSMPVPVAYVPVQLVIDGALSLTSENPVQNKVIAVAIQNLDGRITAVEGQFSEGVTEAVNNWLAAHPEATTTVQDGAITYAKLDANLKGKVDDISTLNSIDGKNLVTDSKSPNTHNGITFTPIEGGYKVTGTSTNTAFRNIYESTSALPTWLKKGKQYYVTYQSVNVQLRIIPNGGSSTASLVNTKTPASFVIPDDTVGIIIRLLVDNGITVNETVYPIITETETPNLTERQLEMITGSVFKYAEQHKTVTGKLIHVTDVNPMSLLRTAGWNETSDITVCGKNIYRNKHGATNYTNAGVTKTFSENKGTITVTSTGATGTTILPDYTSTLNGINWAGLFKFKLPVDHVVTFSANASRNLFVYDNCYMQISDGTNTIAVRGHDVTMLCKANIEYGIRIYTTEGFADTITFKPQIELEGFATDFEPFSGIYTENGSLVNVMSRTSNPAHVMSLGNIANVISIGEADVSLTYDLITKTNKANCKFYDDLAEVGQKPMMLTFIDDDTTNLSLVRLYRNTMTELGIIGNYAVITDHLEADASLKQQLLDYEAEGFGMLCHASDQSGSATDYFRPGEDRDIDAVRENMIAGLRYMKQVGFISGNHWVTPYGVNDPEIIALAKSIGFESLVSGMNSTPVIHSKTSKYNIPRYSLSDTSDNAVIKRGIDAILEYGGWILITTHANTWGDNINLFSDKINDVVTYARTNDIKIVNFEEGFKTFFQT